VIKPAATDNPGRAVRSALLACGMALIAAGCTVVDTVWAPPLVLPCPDHKVIADLNSVTKFQDGPGRDIVDVDFEGLVLGVDLACNTDMDVEDTAGTMDVEVRLQLGAQRGPANRTRQAVMPYFISVTDRDRKVLYREDFEAVVDFEGNRTKLRFRSKPIVLELPIREGLSEKSYLIFTGLMLTKEQLKLNRTRRGGLLR